MTMDNNIVTFPGFSPKRGTTNPSKKGHWWSPENARKRANMHTLLFRSSHLIVESDEADLVRDVRFSLDRAEAKLERIQARLEALREQTAAQLELLTTAETKLTAAIVAALLSGQR